MLGLAAFCLLVGQTFWHLFSAVRRAQDPFIEAAGLGLMAGLFGWLVHSAFYLDLIFLHNGMLFFICVGAARLLGSQEVGVSVSGSRACGLPASRLWRPTPLTVCLVVLAGATVAATVVVVQPGPVDLVSYAAMGAVGVVTLMGLAPRAGADRQAST